MAGQTVNQGTQSGFIIKRFKACYFYVKTNLIMKLYASCQFSQGAQIFQLKLQLQIACKLSYWENVRYALLKYGCNDVESLLWQISHFSNSQEDNA